MDAHPVKAYLDASVVIAYGKDDLPAETTALRELLKHHEAGTVHLVTSEVTRKELDEYEGEQLNVDAIYALLDKVPYITVQELKGINTYFNQWTCINSPMIEDEPVFKTIRQLGFEYKDAHHSMVAIRGKCDVLLTTDGRTMLNRKQEIESRYPIKLMKPSELAARVG